MVNLLATTLLNELLLSLGTTLLYEYHVPSTTTLTTTLSPSKERLLTTGGDKTTLTSSLLLLLSAARATKSDDSLTNGLLLLRASAKTLLTTLEELLLRLNKSKVVVVLTTTISGRKAIIYWSDLYFFMQNFIHCNCVSPIAGRHHGNIADWLTALRLRSTKKWTVCGNRNGHDLWPTTRNGPRSLVDSCQRV